MVKEHDPSAGQPQPQEPYGPGSDTAARATPTVHKSTTRLRLKQPPQKPHKGRIRLWLKEHRVAAAAAQSTRKGRGVAVLLLSAFIGFFFGMANNQVTDWVKRADDCSAALTHYHLGVENFEAIAFDYHNGSPEQKTEANHKYNNDIAAATDTIDNKCPMHPRHQEYLSDADIDAWVNAHLAIVSCFKNNNNICDADTEAKQIWQKNGFDLPQCPLGEGDCPTGEDVILNAASEFTTRLTIQANQVGQWGLGRRGQYVVTHLW
jgi:hypothetical protein